MTAFPVFPPSRCERPSRYKMVALLEEAATIARKDPVKYVDEWLDSYAGLFSVGITLSDEVFCQKPPFPYFRLRAAKDPADTKNPRIRHSMTALPRLLQLPAHNPFFAVV